MDQQVCFISDSRRNCKFQIGTRNNLKSLKGKVERLLINPKLEFLGSKPVSKRGVSILMIFHKSESGLKLRNFQSWFIIPISTFFCWKLNPSGTDKTHGISISELELRLSLVDIHLFYALLWNFRRMMNIMRRNLPQALEPKIEIKKLQFPILERVRGL